MGAQGTRVVLGPISFIFMQFLGKIWPNNRLAPPPWGLVAPVWGNPGSATVKLTSYLNAFNKNNLLLISHSLQWSV